MKLFRFGGRGTERSGVVDEEGVLRDASSVVSDFTPETIGEGVIHKLRSFNFSSFPVIPYGSRIGSCISSYRRFFCIGLNYNDHATEAGLALPGEPIVFMKVCDLSGPDDDILLPNNSQQTDWEVELAVVIGKAARHVSVDKAQEHVAGYCVTNDVTERDYQFNHGGQWVKGKSCESFAPLGPYLVTPDEVDDPQDLDLHLDVNGIRMQSGHTRDMVFSVAEIIARLSYYFMLHPGDVVATGTPAGVGMGKKPKQFLKAGDQVHLGISGLGCQHHAVTNSCADNE